MQSKSNLIKQWRNKIIEHLPELQKAVAQAGVLGIVGASVAILASDPAMTTGVITGLLGNFISDAVARWQNASSDQEREDELQAILADIRSNQLDQESKDTIFELNLAQIIGDHLSDKIDQLSDLVKFGFVTEEQVYKIKKINTGGGPYVDGNLHLQRGATFVGGDLINISYGTPPLKDVSHKNLNRRGKPDPPLFSPKNFVGRKAELDYLDSFAAQSEPGYLLIEAPPGYGKSWLIARFIETLNAKKSSVPLYLHYELSKTASHNTVNQFLQELIDRLWDSLENREEIATEQEQLRRQFRNLWKLAIGKADENQPLLLIVDGLDRQAQEFPTIADLLPRVLAPYVHIIVTSRPVAILRQAEDTHPLYDAKLLELGSFYVNDIHELLSCYALPNNITNDDNKSHLNLPVWLYMATQGIPLFVHALCKIVPANEIKPNFRLQEIQLPEIEKYLEEELENLVAATNNHQQTKDLLGILSVAYDSLSPDELAKILRLTKRQVTNALKPVERWLTQDSVKFRHELFRLKVKEEVGSDPRYITLLLEWCKSYWKPTWHDHTPAYVLRYFVKHLVDIQDTSTLYRSIDKQWMYLKVQRTGRTASFAEDVKSALDLAAAANPPDWTPLVRNCLIYATLVSNAEDDRAAWSSPMAVYWGPTFYAKFYDSAELTPLVREQLKQYDSLFRALRDMGDFAAAIAVAEKYAQVYAQLKYNVPDNNESFEQDYHYIQQQIPILVQAQGVLRFAKLDGDPALVERIIQQIPNYDTIIYRWMIVKVVEIVAQRGEQEREWAHWFINEHFAWVGMLDMWIEQRDIFEYVKKKFGVIYHLRRESIGDSLNYNLQPLPTDGQPLPARRVVRDSHDVRLLPTEEELERQREATRKQWQDSAYLETQLKKIDQNNVEFILKSLLDANNRDGILRTLQIVSTIDDIQFKERIVSSAAATLAKALEVELAFQFIKLTSDRFSWSTLTSAAIYSGKRAFIGEILTYVRQDVAVGDRANTLLKIANGLHDCLLREEANQIRDLAIEFIHCTEHNNSRGALGNDPAKKKFQEKLFDLLLQFGELEKAFTLTIGAKQNWEELYFDWLSQIIHEAIQTSQQDLLSRIRSRLEQEIAQLKPLDQGNEPTDSKRSADEWNSRVLNSLLANLSQSSSPNHLSATDDSAQGGQSFTQSPISSIERLHETHRSAQSEDPDFYRRIMNRGFFLLPNEYIEKTLQNKDSGYLRMRLKDEPSTRLHGEELGLIGMIMVEIGDEDGWRRALELANKKPPSDLQDASVLIAPALAAHGHFNEAVGIAVQIGSLVIDRVFPEICYYLSQSSPTPATREKIASALQLASRFGRRDLFAVLSASVPLLGRYARWDVARNSPLW